MKFKGWGMVFYITSSPCNDARQTILTFKLTIKTRAGALVALYNLIYPIWRGLTVAWNYPCIKWDITLTATFHCTSGLYVHDTQVGQDNISQFGRRHNNVRPGGRRSFVNLITIITFHPRVARYSTLSSAVYTWQYLNIP